MKIIKNRYGEDVPWYDSLDEEMAAIRAFLDGNYGELTALEVQEFRQCEEDPNGVKFEAEHAGMLAEKLESKV